MRESARAPCVCVFNCSGHEERTRLQSIQYILCHFVRGGLACPNPDSYSEAQHCSREGLWADGADKLETVTPV